MEFRIKIGSTNEVNNMNKEIRELIKAITKLIQTATEHSEVEKKISEQRLKDWVKNSNRHGFHIDDDDMSWPDDFEEDWE